VIGCVAVMVIPLAPAVLDVLLALNLALSVLLALVAAVIPSGMWFSALPSVVLISTLLRLALTLSATRLILLQADAGRVIAAFGEFVLQGSDAVGAVFFLVLTLVLYLVIARGAERVAEVGARFTLDAMPGWQMAIDADMRSGALTSAGAHLKRQRLRRESQFYGAMDGAMKFVKGDAIASIAITAINFFAGVAVGIGIRGMGIRESARAYGLLAIGNGLIMQVCLLLVSTAAGVIVTRVASDDDTTALSAEIGAQLFQKPRLIGLSAMFMVALALVPGLPALPFLIAAAIGVALVWGRQEPEPRSQSARFAKSPQAKGRYAVEPLTIELGADLAAEFGNHPDARAALSQELEHARRRIFADLGVAVPEPNIPMVSSLAPRAYRIRIQEIEAGQGSRPAGVPLAFGADAIACHLERLVRRRPQDFLDLQDVQDALDQLSESVPALVRAVIPTPIPLPLLVEILRRLVQEQVTIRPLRQILEALSIHAHGQSDPAELAEEVRGALARYITDRYGREGTLDIHQLDPDIEEALRDALHKGPSGAYLALAPDLARAMVQAAREVCVPTPGDRPPVIVTHRDVRRHFRRLIAPELPDVAVLSYDDLAPEVTLKHAALIAFNRAVE
jgi:type III secretion protein V